MLVISTSVQAEDHQACCFLRWLLSREPVHHLEVFLQAGEHHVGEREAGQPALGRVVEPRLPQHALQHQHQRPQRRELARLLRTRYAGVGSSFGEERVSAALSARGVLSMQGWMCALHLAACECAELRGQATSLWGTQNVQQMPHDDTQLHSTDTQLHSTDANTNKS